MATPPIHNYNIEKLNFSGIQKDISIIPKIIKKKSHIGFRSSTSVNHSRHNDSFQNEQNDQNDQNKEMSMRSSRMHKKIKSQDNIVLGLEISNNSELNMKEKHNKNNLTFIGSIPKNNYKDRAYLMELEYKKNIAIIEKENKRQIEKLRELYENKINEIRSFYEMKCEKYENLMVKTLNDFKNLNHLYITITEHKNIVAKIKEKWKEQIMSIKKDYDNYIANLTNILKFKEKYRGLLARILIYKSKNINISKIEEILNSNNKEQSDSYLKDITTISQLSEEINYHSALFELKMAYNDRVDKICQDKENKLNNLSKVVANYFDKLASFNYKNKKEEFKKQNHKNIIELSLKQPNNSTNFQISNRYNNNNSNNENKDMISLNQIEDNPFQYSSINNESAIKSLEKSSIDLDNLNLEESFPNKPTNTIVVNDLIKDNNK